jgi:NTE family protein
VTHSVSSSSAAALGRLFESEVAGGEAVAFCLPGGTPLFEAGDEADQLYFLRTGRLAVRLGDVHAPARLGLIHPGEPVGEMALIAGLPHTMDVFALRDSELIALPRDAFFRAAESAPDLLLGLSRLVLSRVRGPLQPSSENAARAFAVTGLSPDIDAMSFATQLSEAIRRLGHSAAVVGAGTGPPTPEWFSNIESANDFVLYAAEHDEMAWRALVGRQVDGVLQLARGGSRPPAAAAILTPRSPAPTDLILLQEPNCAAPVGSSAWTKALAPVRLFHVRRRRQSDIDRMARVLAGQAVALVLSGGAARAYAHVGAIRALHEADVPIDFVGGVSMGAVIGAGIGMGWDDRELDRHIRKAFVESSPLDDIAVPIIAMTRGDKVRERLAEHFGDRTVCDLWLPFFCGSTNLTTGAYRVYRQGLVRDVLLASLSLPGVMPPVIVGEDVLVDGAVLNNFPADIMRTLHNGPIIGVDVGRGRSIEARDVQTPKSIIRWILSGDWRNGPPIVSLLMRAATVTAARETAEARSATDVLVLPDVDGIEIRDWQAYEPAVAEGRRATLSALAAIDGAVTDLRRRPTLSTP